MLNYGNIEESMDEVEKREAERKAQLAAARRIPEGPITFKFKTVKYGVGQNSQKPQWEVKAFIQAPGKPYHQAERTLYYPEHVDFRIKVWIDMLRAWGLDFADQANYRQDPVLAQQKFLEKVEEIIDLSPVVIAKCVHKTTNEFNQDGTPKIRMNFYEDLESLEQVVNLDAPQVGVASAVDYQIPVAAQPAPVAQPAPASVQAEAPMAAQQPMTAQQPMAQPAPVQQPAPEAQPAPGAAQRPRAASPFGGV